MDNLHRSLAPISSAAWADLEDEARRTFRENLAARRVVDVLDPAGFTLSSIPRGRVRNVDDADPGVLTRVRVVDPVIELRVPFRVSRREIDDVERGAQDADWQPVKDAAKQLAYAEDRIIINGNASAGITGIREESPKKIAVPNDPVNLPDAVAQAVSALRLAGVQRGYSLLLSADLYTAIAETTDHGFPVFSQINRVLGDDGEVIWAPAIDGALLVSTRGGDFELHLGQDTSIGYQSHDDDSVELYFQETFGFLVNTAEASVTLT